MSKTFMKESELQEWMDKFILNGGKKLSFVITETGKEYLLEVADSGECKLTSENEENYFYVDYYKDSITYLGFPYRIRRNYEKSIDGLKFVNEESEKVL
ncbi:hypothetical protein [Victivallis vadensis]|uniref:Uncharacterized protein n=1 Tax=Victivallis vadensis TaxID=172901 RepID=A0A2U1B6G0_9BACT|nr:hypothetical protein [Victivallis vadensis]PVY44250.1 hypothetical protein C8D82_1075 [Victivallis vadensis]